MQFPTNHVEVEGLLQPIQPLQESQGGPHNCIFTALGLCVECLMNKDKMNLIHLLWIFNNNNLLTHRDLERNLES